MRKLHLSALLGTASLLAITAPAFAKDFDIPKGDLKGALDAYISQAGVPLVVMADAVRGVHTQGAKGDMAPDVALAHILRGTGFVARHDTSGMIAVVPEPAEARSNPTMAVTRLADAEPQHAASSVETVVVTSSKIKGDIQTVPIAITALSQEQLTSRQIAGGPDLVKEVPNLTFSKTNFSGYNLEIRGIGTQAISVTTDPAVAVAFNDTPFIRNHFFEQEFYDVAQVEVLRGPQGTLYGRNATAGVVNVVSAKPTDEFEAMLSADWGNYTNRRYEGMVNLPIVGDRLALRIAGEWTKRDGYTLNETTGKQTDGRDLWSSRVTLGWKPTSTVEADLVWEHFQESDDRLRSGKQLCKTDFGPGARSLTDTGTVVAADGTVVHIAPGDGTVFGLSTADFSQGCLPASLYSKDSFEVPNGFSLPFVSGASFLNLLSGGVDPYSQTTQSTNLRDIQSVIEPKYLAKNDTLEFNASWNIAPVLTLSSDSAYNNDFLYSTEDYNRFDTSPGIFFYPGSPYSPTLPDPNSSGGIYCDPQLGCSDRLVIQDLDTEHSWQLSQEFRLASNFSGPLNFSVGGNALHYETREDYYVFANTFTMITLSGFCDTLGGNVRPTISNSIRCLPNGRSYSDPTQGGGVPTEGVRSVDPNSFANIDGNEHNYFVSKNPYVLNSYAGFGEAYYNVTPELKLTAGLRWTDDEKHFTDIPSELIAEGWGYPSTGSLDQKWNEWTGRFVANWSPKLSFTDQSMFYASYARGYKAGGANPPGAVLLNADAGGNNNIAFPVHPLAFQPEFIDAYEAGTKNTLLDGGLTLNGDVFFYNYKGYQISQIVDRSSINLNFDATVKGAELEATYEPLPGLKFSFAGGYEDTNINKNQYAIDLMDRTAGHAGWLVMKPSVGQSSNCIIPEYVAAALIQVWGSGGGQGSASGYVCGAAYTGHVDPVTGINYVTETGNGTHAPVGSTGGFLPAPAGYPGYDPNSVDPALNPALLTTVNNGMGLPPNNGEGFEKPVGSNELPNAPHFTLSLTGDYTMPVSANWAATLHGDFYWQSQSWARVFNDRPYDKIRGYSTSNVALILTDASGWQVMGYVKNIFNATAITGDFLNSDDSGLTTNIFLTDPRLYGVRITKHFDANDLPGGSFDLFSDAGGKRPQIWLTLGGNFDAFEDKSEPWSPASEPPFPAGLPTPEQLQKNPQYGFDKEGELTYQPSDSDWVLKAGIRYGRTSRNKSTHKSLAPQTRTAIGVGYPGKYVSVPCSYFRYGQGSPICSIANDNRFVDAKQRASEAHMMLDFTLGKDIGIGTIGAGVRVAQFTSKSSLDMNADAVYNFVPLKYQIHHIVSGFESHEKRSFHGIGPELTWDGSHALWRNEADGQIALDWGVNAGVLFGRQSVNLHHASYSCYHNFIHSSLNHCSTPVVAPKVRSRNVTVPNLGGYAGLSVRYNDAKISLGYRADEFFNAMDGGQATAKKYDRGFYGPYLNISLGFGG